MIDLHTHSNASDGQYSPSELMAIAAENKITAIALTDHDTVAGVNEARAAANRLGLKFFAGIEISAEFPKGTMHILGYNIDINNPELIKACEWSSNQRLERGERIFKFLESKNILLTRESVSKYAAGEALGRPHFARAMIDAGYVGTVSEAFDKYLDTPEFKDAAKRRKLSPEESIKLILNANGIPVLAHPISLKADENTLDDIVKTLISYGLAGMECYHSKHTPEMTDKYIKIAEKNNLFITAGSDFHGEKVKPNTTLGAAESLKFLEALEK